MRVRVRPSGPLRVAVGSAEVEIEVEVEAAIEGGMMAGEASATLAQVLDAVSARYPHAHRYLRDATGALAPGIRVLVNDARLDDADILGASLHDGDVVALLMPVQGG